MYEPSYEYLINLSDKELVEHARGILQDRYDNGHVWHIDYKMMSVVDQLIKRLDKTKNNS